MNSRIIKAAGSIGAAAMAAPLLTFAQTTNTAATGSTTGLSGVLKTISGLIGMVIPILLALAVLFFLWGVLQYILKIGGDDGQKGARNTMIWGIIAIAVMVSIWGLVGILQSTFGLSSGGAPTTIQLIPTVQNPS